MAGLSRSGRRQLGVGLAFESVPVKDFSNADPQLRLPKCVAALAHLLGQGHSVYVHCTARVSRSPSVVAAYLHWCSDGT
jgi:protein-tyrosine phosphatase